MVQDESSIFLLRLQDKDLKNKNFCTTFLVHVGHYKFNVNGFSYIVKQYLLNVLKLTATVLTAKCVLLYTKLHRVLTRHDDDMKQVTGFYSVMVSILYHIKLRDFDIHNKSDNR